MQRRLVSCAALLGLMLVVPSMARAEDKAAKSDKPTVILRVAAFDTLIADTHYLADIVGQGETVKQLEGVLKGQIGDKGLNGIDTKKPIGAYASASASLPDSPFAVLIPIADEKAFLDLLTGLGVTTEKGKDDIYTVNHEKIPATVPVYLRFANNYAYITALNKGSLAKEQLLDPAKVFPEGSVGAASLTANIDRVPDHFKELALGYLENRLASLKDKESPGETGAQKKFRIAVVDEMGTRLKSLLNEGGETTLRLDLDRKAADLALSMSVTAKAGSTLATTIRDLGQVKSIAASLIGSDSAMNGALNVSLPKNLRALLIPAIEEDQKKILDNEGDQAKREALAALAKAFKPTLTSGELDVAADLRGPADNGLYTGVFGIKVKQGATIDKTLRDIIAGLPEKERKVVSFDVEKVGSVGIHRIIAPGTADENSKRLFGDNAPIYFAVRDDVFLVCAGEKGLSVLKEALASEAKASKIIDIHLAMSRLAPLMVKDNKAAPAIAKEVFAKDKDGDKIHITVEGGKALRMRLDMKAQLVAFFAKLDKAKKGG